MTTPRAWFYAALAVFVAWVVSLGGLAVVSGKRPEAKVSPVAPVLSTAHRK
jgi:hypothetical protein